MSEVNQKAVEAVLALPYTCTTCGGSGELISCDRDGEFSVACLVCKGEELGPEFEREPVERILQAAEPHIRSQLLTELAEEFETRGSPSMRGDLINGQQAFAFAAQRCRELAAKEESDG